MALVIFTGEDSFRARRALHALLEKERGRGPARIESFDADESDNLAHTLAAFFNARTLWQERKIAVVRAASWSGAVPKVAESDLLVLLLEQSPRTAPKGAVVTSFPLLKGAELAEWIRNAAKDLGNDLAADLARALIELHGSDTEAIWNELMVLSSANPGKPLTLEDLKTFRAWIPHVKDFAFVDSVLAKDRPRALRLLHHTLAEGVSPLLILANLAAHFRAMLVAKTDGKSADVFFRGRHPFWVSKISEHAERFTEQELRAALRRLWRLDYAIKTGIYSPEIAIETFVLGV
jgi:DNA polymerase III delta subunit